MKKTFKKAIAVLLAILMVAFSVPFSAFAANLEVGGANNVGWWGDDNWRGWENSNIPKGEQDYNGWNSPDYDLALSWADAVSMNSDLGMQAETQAMLSEYKPVLTITVSDQGTADNRIYRKYYGYSSTYNYEKVKADGNILNPADLKAGQRIAVTFEIGGFDMLYAGQLKGTIDTTKLAYAYYTLNPSSTDRWKQCSTTQTTQAFITRGYGFYGDAATDGGSMVTDNETGQFYTPFSCNTAVPTSAYVGKDARTIGDNGMIICTLSMEVLQDCNLAEAIDLTKDNDNNPTYGTTTFTCYDPDEIGSKRNRFTLDVTDNKWTAGLIAVNYNDYDASGAGTECTHANTEVQNAVEATCTTDGYTGDTVCLDCGATIETGSTIPATGHSLEETAAKDATCTEAGNSAYWTCSVCGKMFADADGATEITEVPTISATGHSLSEVKEVPSTCTVKGTAAYWTCTACGKMFSDAEGTAEISAPAELPLADHNYNMVKTEATCTEKSSEVYTCTECGDTYTTHVDPAKGHTPVSANNAVAATCTTDGKEADTVCSVCGTTLTTGAVIPATGHTPVSANNAVAATCTTDGKEADTVCSVCGVTLTTGATIPATGHAYGDTWTSNGNGTHSKVCINAGDDTKTEDCSYSYSVTKAPTIDETGIGTYTCTKCHYSYDIVLDKVTCTHANATKTEEVPATCTEEGTEAYWTCNDCGKMFSDEACTIEIASPVVIAPKGHTPVTDEAVAATCISTGLTEGSHCSVCGEVLEEQQVTDIDPNNHTDIVIDMPLEATCTDTGLTEGSHCGACGTVFVEQETINALGHDYVDVKDSAVAPTCTTDGKEADKECSRCGDTISGATIPATGHTPVSADNAVDPTLDAPGKEADTVCSVCGVTLAEGAVIPALEGVNITVEATDLGTTAINGEDATNGATVKVLKNSKVALTAAPVEGAEFVGWALNGKIVSESANTTVTALADATYTPVFTETAAATFTVVFVDNYGNVISTQTVADASEIVAPTAPTRPGYTFKGWSVDYTTLTTGATIYAQFEKDAAATYTVTATGCTITTAAGVTATDVMTDVAYDTSVTITANGGTASSWKIGDSTVAFGESYTFYVGSNVTVVPQFDSAVTAKPTVTAVNVSETTGTDGLKRAVFLATRSMTDDCTYIGSGYIYGKAANVTADTSLADVNGSTVKRIDNKTASEQFSVMYGLSAQSGSIAAKAYLAYVDANGDTQVIYADLQTYTYA